ncbi:unnamed protein product [Camellia sinensis]
MRESERESRAEGEGAGLRDRGAFCEFELWKKILRLIAKQERRNGEKPIISSAGFLLLRPDLGPCLDPDDLDPSSLLSLVTPPICATQPNHLPLQNH